VAAAATAAAEKAARSDAANASAMQLPELICLPVAGRISMCPAISTHHSALPTASHLSPDDARTSAQHPLPATTSDTLTPGPCCLLNVASTVWELPARSSVWGVPVRAPTGCSLPVQAPAAAAVQPAGHQNHPGSKQ
jgi:hypothetical protein